MRPVALMVTLGALLALPACSAQEPDPSPAIRSSPHTVGEDAYMGPIRVTLTSVNVADHVGSPPHPAADGGELVILEYTLHNGGAQPVAPRDMPRDIRLISPSGVEYAPDVGATAAFAASDSTIDEKLWSDLNPGITVHAVEVFEVSSKAFDSSTWQVAFSGDGPRYANLSAVTHVDSHDPKIEARVVAYYEALDGCSGSDDQAACKRLDEISKSLQQSGYCYGEGVDAGYKSDWKPCKHRG